jgi:hypothetical protein
MNRIRHGDDKPAIIRKARGGSAETALKIVRAKTLHQNFAHAVPDRGREREKSVMRMLS